MSIAIFLAIVVLIVVQYRTGVSLKRAGRSLTERVKGVKATATNVGGGLLKGVFGGSPSPLNNKTPR